MIGIAVAPPKILFIFPHFMLEGSLIFIFHVHVQSFLGSGCHVVQPSLRGCRQVLHGWRDVMGGELYSGSDQPAAKSQDRF